MTRILVTGGAGFVGSHLCDALIAQGHDVTCLDSLVTGSAGNIRHLLSHPNFRFVEQDVTVPYLCEVDEIYNLASPASPAAYQADPLHTTRTSVMGAFNMLDLAVKTGAKILQASTSEVYGDPDVHPQPESYWGHVNPIGPRGCYDEGKRCAETLFFDYHRKLGVRIKVARIFNTYGPRMQPDDGRVISNFIVQALGRQDLTIYGDGLQTRSFCYVSDLVEGLIRFMATDDSVCGPLNIGNPHECTMLELAEHAIALTRSRSRIIHLPAPENDPRQRCPDIALAKRLIGWAPQVTLADGLALTAASLAERLATTVSG